MKPSTPNPSKPLGLFAGLCLSTMLAASPARAADPTIAGEASIGTIPANPPGVWWGLWPTQLGNDPWHRYTILGSTATNHTYINSQPGGSIIFRSNNFGPLAGDPDSSGSLAWIDNGGTFNSKGLRVTGGSIVLNGDINFQQAVNAQGDINLITGSLVVSSGLIDGRGKGVSGAVGPSTMTASPKGAVIGSNQFSGSDAFGVYGYGGGGGIKGETASGVGASGSSLSGLGVSGSSSSNNGVFGTSNTGMGVYGYSTSGYGVMGGTGANDKYAGYFVGGALGAYGKGKTYGVYSDGPIYVNNANATKVGGSGTWSTGSDARIKKNIVDYRGGLAELEKVRPVRFQYNGLGETTDDGSEFVGVIAQELEPIAPYMVSKAKRKLHPGDKETTDVRQVDPNAFTYMLINAVKELARENKELAAQNRQVVAQSNEIRRVLCASKRGEALCGAKMALKR